MLDFDNVDPMIHETQNLMNELCAIPRLGNEQSASQSNVIQTNCQQCKRFTNIKRNIMLSYSLVWNVVLTTICFFLELSRVAILLLRSSIMTPRINNSATDTFITIWSNLISSLSYTKSKIQHIFWS